MARQHLADLLQLLTVPAVDRNGQRAPEEPAHTPLHLVGNPGHVRDRQLHVGGHQLSLLLRGYPSPLEAGTLHLQPGVRLPVGHRPYPEREIHLLPGAEQLLQEHEIDPPGPLVDVVDRHVTLVQLDIPAGLPGLVQVLDVAVAHAADAALEQDSQIIMEKTGGLEPRLDHHRGELHRPGLAGDHVPAPGHHPAPLLQGLKVVQHGVGHLVDAADLHVLGPDGQQVLPDRGKVRGVLPDKDLDGVLD